MGRDLNSENSITIKAYFFGLLVIFASVYAQYFIGGLNEISGTLLVYGIPILVTGLIWGRTVIRKSLNHLYVALKFGLGYFGAFTLLGTFASIVILFILLEIDPTTVSLLNHPNPVIPTSPERAWLMVGFSFLVVGPSEEYLFRGFIYGGLLSIFRNRHWLFLAFISSLLFASVHLYYALVYGVASLVIFADLITFGMGMAATYYVSNGNLLIPSIVHGAYDASGFISVATSFELGMMLRVSLTLIGLIVAIVLFVQKILTRQTKKSSENLHS